MFLRYFSIYYLVFTISIIGLISACNSGHKADEIKDDPKKLTEAKNLLKKLNYEYGKFMNRETINDWNISSDLDQDLIYPTEDNIFKMDIKCSDEPDVLHV
ncbi:hypothetical protein PV327_001540 [Microctonus hyperodae]|uniref:Lipoprotein n=1 Tax=Microctonus hyperodae TaxID=165561 RepID=A0AA39L330_MICHY|nr:hypothetical protein PV327_001540 [Microctonus hyperodae]